MNDTTKISTQEPTVLTPAAQPVTSLAPILQAVVSGQLTVEQVQQMQTIQHDHEENEARKAFHIALAEFKRNPPKVIKDLANDQYGSMYASLGAMVDAANVAMGSVGLSARWDYLNDDNKIGVTCILSHAQGHQEQVTAWAEPDKSGNKNPLQQAKSTRTYLKVDTFSAVTGLVAQNATLDDDGTGAGPIIELIDTKQVLEIMTAMNHPAVDEDRAMAWIKQACKVESLDEIKLSAYPRVLKMLKDQGKAADAVAKTNKAEGSDNDNS